jgi:DNA-directed RNA polymerase specialized sigma subunit
MLIPDRHVQMPTTEAEWLMTPHVEIPNLDESHIDAVAEAIDALPERSADIINAIFFERVSYAELGRRLKCSKPHAWRLTLQAIQELRVLLVEHAAIKERYGND